jgi:hypothetical protein
MTDHSSSDGSGKVKQSFRTALQANTALMLPAWGGECVTGCADPASTMTTTWKEGLVATASNILLFAPAPPLTHSLTRSLNPTCNRSHFLQTLTPAASGLLRGLVFPPPTRDPRPCLAGTYKHTYVTHGVRMTPVNRLKQAMPSTRGTLRAQFLHHRIQPLAAPMSYLRTRPWESHCSYSPNRQDLPQKFQDTSDI